MAIAKVGSCEPSVKTDAGKWGKTGKMKSPPRSRGPDGLWLGLGFLCVPEPKQQSPACCLASGASVNGIVNGAYAAPAWRFGITPGSSSHR